MRESGPGGRIESGRSALVVWGALLVLSALLFAFQYTTLDKFEVLSPGVGFYSWGEFVRIVDQEIDLGWSDAILALGILFVCVGLVLAEIRNRLLTLFLARVWARETSALWLLGLSSLVLVRFYLARGQLSWGGDAAEHIAYASIAARSFALGEFPIWTNYFVGGSPYLQFYGFLFFYLVGLVDLLCRDLFLSLKLVLTAGHVLSGLGMYALARQLYGSRPAAFVAGLAYVLSFWHTQHVLVMGRLPLSIFYALLPWPFFFVEKARQPGRGLKALVGGGLALAGLTFTHPGYGFWATFFTALYALSRTGWQRRRSRVWLAWGAGLVLAGLVFGSYLTLPMWVEREYTGLAGGVSLEGVPDPGWQHLLVWSNYRIRLWPLPEHQFHWYGGYIGLSLVALAAVGLAGGWRQRRRLVLAVSLCLLASLLLVFAYRTPPLQALPVVRALNAGRYLLFVVFFLALCSGAGIFVLQRWRGARWVTAALLVVLADLGPTTFQHPYLEHWVSPAGYPPELVQETRDRAAPRAEGELPDVRLFATTGQIHPFVAISWLYWSTGIPLPQALYAESPRNAMHLASAWTQYATRIIEETGKLDALHTHPEAGLIFGGFTLFNIRYVIGRLQDQGERQDMYSRIGWPLCSPVLVSAETMSYPQEELVGVDREGGMEKLIRHFFPERENIQDLVAHFPALWIIGASGVDAEQRTLERVVLPAGAAEGNLGTLPGVEVLEHRVWNQRVELRFRTTAKAYARLSYSYYPYLRVLVDGEEVEAMETADGCIALLLEGGEHRVVLEPYLSPLRKGLLAMEGVLLLGAVGLLVWRRRKK